MFNGTQFSGQDIFFFLIILVFMMIVLFVTRKLLKVSFPYFFMGLLGLIIGLAVGSLVATPLGKLPGNFGRFLPLIVDVFITVAFLDLFLNQSQAAAIFFRKLIGKIMPEKEDDDRPEIILDTSVIIDGRIEEIVRSGFILGTIILPQFILNELQAVADSADTTKRTRGRKGIEVLDNIQNNPNIDIEITDELLNNREAVDSKLIKLAKLRHGKILTVDYNLNKIAKFQKVTVLNINELAEAIKPVLIPGENISVKIVQEGKEPNQGVGYLSDGTMIVVEGGDKYIGKELNCEVTRIYQTIAGKMIFVSPKKRSIRARN